jgi:predicted DNA-binding transcriptional regulator AlpA
MEDDREYFSGPDLYQRYGITHQTLWRWLNDPRLGFPQPRVINRRRYFPRNEIEAWDMSRPRLKDE